MKSKNRLLLKIDIHEGGLILKKKRIVYHPDINKEIDVFTSHWGLWVGTDSDIEHTTSKEDWLLSKEVSSINSYKSAINRSRT